MIKKYLMRMSIGKNAVSGRSPKKNLQEIHRTNMAVPERNVLSESGFTVHRLDFRSLKVPGSPDIPLPDRLRELTFGNRLKPVGLIKGDQVPDCMHIETIVMAGLDKGTDGKV
jgi:hypothetical protein